MHDSRGNNVRVGFRGIEVPAHNTDSAFVRLPDSLHAVSEDRLFQLGEEMAAQVTEAFKAALQPDVRESCVVKLEMEKYLRPLILYKKKRYVGIAYEQVGRRGKMLAKGIELVRRDAVPLVRSAQAQVMEALLERQSPTEAVASVKAAVRRVQALPLGGPFAEVVLSKSLRQTYANPEGMPHVKVASLMNERDPGSAPRVGDRVEYVVIASESKRVVDRVEDVGHATRLKLPPDWFFYVEALERPLLRILEVPLASIAPGLHQELREFFELEKATALSQRKKHSHARQGIHWVEGLACKKGPPQRKLEFFGFAVRQDDDAARPSSAALATELLQEGDYGARSSPALAAAREEEEEEEEEGLPSAAVSCSSTSAKPRQPQVVRPHLRGPNSKRACAALLDRNGRDAKLRQTTL